MLDTPSDGLSNWILLLQTGDVNGSLVLPLGLQLGLLIISFVGVAFFTSAEAALIAVNKIRIRFLSEQGNSAARAVDRVLGQHEKFFATILLSQNAFTIFATAIGTALAAELLQDSGYAALVTTLVMTVVISIFGEITPKTVAASYSERWSLLTARPVGLMMTICTPFIYLFTAVPQLIHKILRTPSDSWQTTFSEGELRMMIDMSHQQGEVESDEAERLHRVFHFRDRRLSEIMTPRTEIVWIEKGMTMREFLALYAEHSHTRFPVYEGSQEAVLGVLSNKEVLIAQGRGEIGLDDPVTDTMRRVDFIPETVTISDAFDSMQDNRLSMMMVTNEYGGIAGLVTLKQLTGVIVGTMVDDDPPSEEADSGLVRTQDGAFIVDGGMTIIELNDRLEDEGLELPEGEYQTVAGLIIAQLGEIPDESNVVQTGDSLITVMNMEGARIDRVRLERVDAAQTGDCG
jgi:putative hemolysin